MAPNFADIFYRTARRSGCCRSSSPRGLPSRSPQPGAGEVDLLEQELRFAGREVAFEIDHEIRHRLLNGLDDVALTLEQLRRAIDAYEAEHDGRGLEPVATTAL